mmetsp:Transcript_61719/g.155851  ORF Transcript_61719/g.155851 Transcript_61719/m.155851 type:complete len:82 (-) Transcript_61719:76-321(-)
MVSSTIAIDLQVPSDASVQGVDGVIVLKGCLKIFMLAPAAYIVSPAMAIDVMEPRDASIQGVDGVIVLNLCLKTLMLAPTP